MATIGLQYISRNCSLAIDDKVLENVYAHPLNLVQLSALVAMLYNVQCHLAVVQNVSSHSLNPMKGPKMMHNNLLFMRIHVLIGIYLWIWGGTQQSGLHVACIHTLCMLMHVVVVLSCTSHWHRYHLAIYLY